MNEHTQTIIKDLLRPNLSGKVGAATDFQVHRVGGGSINDAYRISVAGETFFCKCNSATKFPHLFQKEKGGLEMLAQSKAVKTPAVLDCFEAGGQQFLLLEWIAEGERNETFWETFGKQLALLHRETNSTFGLAEDNYMGSVPQANAPHKNWCLFFFSQRLTPMLKRCAEKQLLSNRQLLRFEQLQKRLPEIFDEEPPSLLHGDLWSGNFLCNQASQPVFIDPAVYFGHRSADLAMTTLFGGFRQPFYQAYDDHFPLPANHREQWTVCNLYPLLIHLYLFGTGYLSQIEHTLQRFA